MLETGSKSEAGITLAKPLARALPHGRPPFDLRRWAPAWDAKFGLCRVLPGPVVAQDDPQVGNGPRLLWQGFFFFSFKQGSWYFPPISPLNVKRVNFAVAALSAFEFCPCRVCPEGSCVLRLCFILWE